MSSLEALSVLLAAIAVTGSAISMASAILAIRAKEKLRRLLAERVDGDARLQRLQMHATGHRLDPEEVDRVRTMVEAEARRLATRDRRRVAIALAQDSKAGERRYLEDVFAAH